MLSDRFIKTVKPQTKHQFIADGGGLYLRIHPTGNKTFVYRTRVDGKAKWTSLGSYPTITLQKARIEAQRLRENIAAPPTVSEAAHEFHTAVLQRDNKKPETPWSYFTRDVLPAFGSTPLPDVTRQDVSMMLQKIVARGSRVAANRTLTTTKYFFTWCVERGWINENPASLLSRRSVGGKETPRARTLTWDEIEQLLHLIRFKLTEGPELGRTTWVMLYLALLTGQRISEVLSFGRVEDGALVGEGKTSPYRVPLLRPIRAVLKLLGDAPRPSRHNHIAAACGKNELTYTPHDLRRTFATRLSDMGVAPHVIEKLLNHKMPGVMAVYNRADYWPERIAAMELWCKKIGAIRRSTKKDRR
jgi:integrase